VTNANLRETERRLPVGKFLRKIEQMGINLKEMPLEIGVASHYLMGGIRVDEDGRTDIPGLFAAGEAIAGIHGANRLGGNALSEILVTGARAGQTAAQYAFQQREKPHPLSTRTEWEEWIEGLLSKQRRDSDLIRLRKSLQEVMWKYAGVERTDDDLSKGLQELSHIQSILEKETVLSHGAMPYHNELHDAIELRLMVNISRAIMAAAKKREESRGAHLRTDFPVQSMDWNANLVVAKKKDDINCTF
jgi:succinate dehydrogenase/fumarate reductase flavoprotein subunit